MGKVYYDMGLLASEEVIETSATDFIGQYIGHTGPKTQKMLEKGLGKVLFIDEAYRLADEHFARQALDEIVDCVTKPQFAQKLIIILAGYDKDINQLMAINPGLTSRFPESIQYDPLPPLNCIGLMTYLCQKQRNDLYDKNKTQFDLSVLERPTHDFSKNLFEKFDRLSKFANWANARDVGTLVKSILGKALQASNGQMLTLVEATVLGELDSMINERSNRENCFPSLRSHLNYSGNATTDTTSSSNPSIQTSSNANTAVKSESGSETEAESESEFDEDEDGEQSSANRCRDAGVTDETWIQLQRDRAAAEAREKNRLKMIEDEKREKGALRAMKEEEDSIRKAQDAAQQRRDENARIRHEQARLKQELERKNQEEILEKARKAREAAEQERRKEQETQKKLSDLGVCVQGYRWLKQVGGYRCAGGSHWVSDAQIRL